LPFFGFCPVPQNATPAVISQLQALSATQQQPTPDQLVPLKAALRCVLLCLKIFYSLNSQGLPEYFEDHINEWMDGFHKLLTLQCEALCPVCGMAGRVWSMWCQNIPGALRILYGAADHLVAGGKLTETSQFQTIYRP